MIAKRIKWVFEDRWQGLHGNLGCEW